MAAKERQINFLLSTLDSAVIVLKFIVFKASERHAGPGVVENGQVQLLVGLLFIHRETLLERREQQNSRLHSIP